MNPGFPSGQLGITVAQMLLELGPHPPDHVHSWVRFARRVISELRLDPGELEGVITADALNAWSRLLDTWDGEATDADDCFRWSDADVDDEQACYLLYSLHKCMLSRELTSRLTVDDLRTHSPFTMSVVKSFADGLRAVGNCQTHLVDQVLATLGSRVER